MKGGIMKFRNCFIDHHGNIWRTETLVKASEKLPVFSLSLAIVSLDEVIRWKLVNLRDYCVHFTRVTDANLKVPIILRDDGYLMVGWHRVIKALSLGIDNLPCKQFITNPEPDFKAE
jgi:hypothetical protein